VKSLLLFDTSTDACPLTLEPELHTSRDGEMNFKMGMTVNPNLQTRDEELTKFVPNTVTSVLPEFTP
jgi:hypothetical protein